MLALAVMLVPSAVFADDPSTVVIDWGSGVIPTPGAGWSGSAGVGYVQATVVAGDDSTTNFQTAGIILGTFKATDKNDNPYTYGVDTFTSELRGEVENGFIDYTTSRNDSCGSYGPPGQESHSFVGVVNGWGAMATGTNNDYAKLQDALYGLTHLRTVNGVNIEANAVDYEIMRELDANNGDRAYAYGTGTGLAQLYCLNAEAWNTGSRHLRLGYGCGCAPYPAYVEYHAVGAGTFETYIDGTSLATLNNLTTTGATSFTINGSSPGGSTDWSGLPAVTVFGTGSDQSCYLQYINNFTTGFDYNDWGIMSQK